MQYARGTPAAVPGVSDAVQADAGNEQTCALRADGIVMCWGERLRGRRRRGIFFDRLAPTEVSGLGGIAQIALGGSHRCFLTRTGGVSCSGTGPGG